MGNRTFRRHRLPAGNTTRSARVLRFYGVSDVRTPSHGARILEYYTFCLCSPRDFSTDSKGGSCENPKRRCFFLKLLEYRASVHLFSAVFSCPPGPHRTRPAVVPVT